VGYPSLKINLVKIITISYKLFDIFRDINSFSLVNDVHPYFFSYSNALRLSFPISRNRKLS